MVPCNLIPSPDPECDPDADRRCLTGRRAERRPLLGEPRASQAGCDGQRLRPKLSGMTLHTAQPSPICLRNRKACRSVDDKIVLLPINFLYILAFDDHFVEPGLARSRQPYRLCAGFQRAAGRCHLARHDDIHAAGNDPTPHRTLSEKPAFRQAVYRPSHDRNSRARSRHRRPSAARRTRRELNSSTPRIDFSTSALKKGICAPRSSLPETNIWPLPVNSHNRSICGKCWTIRSPSFREMPLCPRLIW